MSRSRAFVFTINNYTYDDMTSLLDIDFRYLCFGFEKGKQNIFKASFISLKQNT